MRSDQLARLLEELSDWMRLEGCDPVEWVVCGGVALALQRLQVRTTRDVDVLGGWDDSQQALIQMHSFPEDVQACIRRVAADHADLDGLDERWINLGAARLAQIGLPHGFEKRSSVHRFGTHITLRLLGRHDLLALKLYAASDEFGHRQDVHFGDLLALKPSFKELDTAVEWIRTVPDFEQVRTELKQVLRRMGYDDLAYYV